MEHERHNPVLLDMSINSVDSSSQTPIKVKARWKSVVAFYRRENAVVIMIMSRSSRVYDPTD